MLESKSEEQANKEPDGICSPYLTIQEAAKYLRIDDPKTLERWAKDGEIGFYLLGGKRIFTTDLLDAFIMNRQRKVGGK